MTRDYGMFINSKRLISGNHGIDVGRDRLHPDLFDFQRDLVWWSLRKGRGALFADTGLGKTFMQLEWASRAADRALILAPLAVAHQTVDEAHHWGQGAKYARTQAEAAPTGITVTNYERLHNFDPAAFGAVVLDESSILKSYDGKTRTAIIEAFRNTPMRLACTATPAPNDIAEIANHAEFLGIMTRQGMLATFFVHDQDGWRLKRPARKDFFRWMASWGMFIKRPSDFGYSDNGYDLPPLSIDLELVDSKYVPEGQLFATEIKGISDRARVRKETMEDRCRRAAELVNSEPDEPWLVWVGLNSESDMMASLIPDAVVVEGSQDQDEKADRLRAFAHGESRVLITKPSIAGFGLNFQHCARQVFVGLGDSYEQYYQCIRRSYRFGQERSVHAHIVLTDLEEPIYHNVLAKQRHAEEMSQEVIMNVTEFEREEIGGGVAQEDEYREDIARGADWTLMLGDSAERIEEIPDASVDFSVFSPPFLSLFQYSNSPRDLGNCDGPATFWQHFDWISKGLLRVMKPGRIVAVHVAQVGTTKAHHGVIGLQDFRGMTISHFVEAGFIFHGEITIDKDPQAQAIRTKAKALMFVQKDKDSSWIRPALADYIVLFRAPGENKVPINTDVNNEEWIEFARPIWYNIRESDTLNTAEGKGQEDEKHICPLQLETIERCIRLWSNAGETVFSPFAGIGSEVYQAVKLGRKGLGIELKESYWRAAIRNCQRAERESLGSLFAWADAQDQEAEL